MIAGIKTIQVTAGREAEFEQLFAELRERMRRTEPDCLLYSLIRSRSEPQKYFVQEQYRDEEALRIHEESAHGSEYFPKIRALLSTIDVQYYDVVIE
jgi:quinol monooxygenase YgiN